MTDRVQYLFLEVPNCGKALTEDAQVVDNLCYALGNISTLDDKPAAMEGELFDLLAYAKKEGLKEGIKEGMEKERRATIARLLAFGMSAEDIARALDLSLEEVEKNRK